MCTLYRLDWEISIPDAPHEDTLPSCAELFGLLAVRVLEMLPGDLIHCEKEPGGKWKIQTVTRVYTDVS